MGIISKGDLLDLYLLHAHFIAPTTRTKVALLHCTVTLMYFRLIAITASILLLLTVSIQPNWATTEESPLNKTTSESDLPSVLDDNFFDDLPIEQRRQALREEVERTPQKNSSDSFP